MKQLSVTITGESPLLVQSETLANPLHPLTKRHKQVSGKKSKTDDDHEWLMHSEWEASMYFDDTLGPYLPGVNLQACIVEAAKITKQGTLLKQAMQVTGDRNKLVYTGPRTKDALWSAGFRDVRSVSVMGKKVMRCRPTFPAGWKCTFEILLMDDVISADVLKNVIDTAGRRIGVGTYRPRFGRFTAVTEVQDA